MKKIKAITSDSNSETTLEKKHIEYLIDACTKLTAICSKPHLKVAELKWQPHYTTVFRLIKNKLDEILKNDQLLEQLPHNDYFFKMKNEIFKLFSEFYKFVNQEGQSIGNQESIARKKFFIYVVNFQFLALELQSYFPDGKYKPENVTISKSEPRSWWKLKFSNKVIVERQEFMTNLKTNFTFLNQADIKCFENTLNFTKTNYVTTFEFDLITRLFAPWHKFIEVWRIIYNHPGYLHFGTYGETLELLTKFKDKPGTYVFRASCKDLGFWTIGYVKASKERGQVKVDKSSLIEAIHEGKKKKIYLYPKGEINDQDLSKFNAERETITVDEDQMKLYESFDDFKECKICREAEKDVMLESCGHKICESCYKMLCNYDRKKCPFCNQAIKSITKIVYKCTSDEYVVVSPPDDETVNESSQLDEVEEEPTFENEDTVFEEIRTVSQTSPIQTIPPPPEVPRRPISSINNTAVSPNSNGTKASENIDDGVYMNMINRDLNTNKNTNESIPMKISNELAPKSEYIFPRGSVPKEEDDEEESIYQNGSDELTKWSKEEVDKAMKIARGNLEIVYDILKEYRPL